MRPVPWVMKHWSKHINFWAATPKSIWPHAKLPNAMLQNTALPDKKQHKSNGHEHSLLKEICQWQNNAKNATTPDLTSNHKRTTDSITDDTTIIPSPAKTKPTTINIVCLFIASSKFCCMAYKVLLAIVLTKTAILWYTCLKDHHYNFKHDSFSLVCTSYAYEALYKILTMHE
jgi:hypothetical protein